MMKMNTISNNNEKGNELHNIILPYINQTEKKNDKQKILKCSLRKKNTTIYSKRKRFARKRTFRRSFFNLFS